MIAALLIAFPFSLFAALLLSLGVIFDSDAVAWWF
jgi:hypothetical protein